MAVVPALILYESGTEVSHLNENLIASINGSPSALNDRSMPGIANA